MSQTKYRGNPSPDPMPSAPEPQQQQPATLRKLKPKPNPELYSNRLDEALGKFLDTWFSIDPHELVRRGNQYRKLHWAARLNLEYSVLELKRTVDEVVEAMQEAEAAMQK
jgi:hypothetical protein